MEKDKVLFAAAIQRLTDCLPQSSMVLNKRNKFHEQAVSENLNNEVSFENEIQNCESSVGNERSNEQIGTEAVSYTHLTLPTTSRV